MNTLKKLIALFILFFAQEVNALNPEFKDMSIVVSSCDKYSELWPHFFKQLFKNWPDLDMKIYLVSNQVGYDDKRVTVLNTSSEDQWSDNMIDALGKIDSKYVLYLQDDYFISKAVDEQRLIQALHAMQKANAGYLELFIEDKGFEKRPNEFLLGSAVKLKNVEYRNSLQSAIWDKELLLRLLVENENPWQFEVIGNERSKGASEAFWGLTENSPIEYLNIVDKGFVNSHSLNNARQIGIDYTPSKLPISDENKFLYYLAVKKPKQYKWVKKYLNVSQH